MTANAGFSPDPLVIVSTDSHCGPEPETYRQYLDKKYWSALDDLFRENEVWAGLSQFTDGDPKTLEIVDDRGAIRNGGRTGAWDFVRRLKELDDDGIAGEVVRPGHQLATDLWFGAVNMKPYSAQLRQVGSQAYHRWLADQLTLTGGRITAVADPGPCLDMTSTAAELAWVAQHGFVAAAVPGTVADDALPPLYHPHYEPYWKACVENNLRLTVHAGHGGVQGAFAGRIEKAKKFGVEVVSDDIQLHGMAQARRVFWQLVLGGVFDRYPDLKLAYLELHATWVPGMLGYLDRRFAGDSRLTKTPSEYWREHVMITPTSVRSSEVAMRHQVGVDRMMFGIDYPHPEGTWPNTQEWIRATFGYQAVPEDEARAILGENAIDFFGLDRAVLTAAGQKVGPLPADVLQSGTTVDSVKIDHFHQRSGFNKAIDDPMGWGLRDRLEEDIEATASARA